MRTALAERLLANIMDWSPEDVAAERPILQALATYKYDSYQQFSAGMHFVESLAIWLTNFNNISERLDAYDFVKKRLIFFSEAEMRHLVGLSYHDNIRNVLLRKVSNELAVPDYKIAKLALSSAFKRAERKALFLGLSDGARIDVLRRMAGLSNEQVYGTYLLSQEKSVDMATELRKALSVGGYDASKESFDVVFLLDDFAGSGDSLLRLENGDMKGRIVRCLENLFENAETTQLISPKSLSVVVVVYVATERAFDALKQRAQCILPGNHVSCCILPTYILDDNVKVSRDQDPGFDKLLEDYYDEGIMDRHLAKGGADVIRGYANCSLPLVFAHNSPNNSVYLLWADKPNLKIKALFPRVSRHRE